MQGRQRVSDGTTVNVVEDDGPMLDALTLLLRSAGFQVRGYPSAEAFLAEIGPTRAICLLTDVRLPGMDGLMLYRHLVSLRIEPATVVITGHGDIPMAVAALKAGVMDFVEKPFNPDILLDSISDASRRAAADSRSRAAAAAVESRYRKLTAREKEILNLLVAAQPNKVIATKLGISVRTVEHHRAHIMEKMEMRTLSHLIKAALSLTGNPC
jgi:two-component system, LuxR family, response regulator FixJ